MGHKVLYPLQLVLGDFYYFSPDAIYEDLRVFGILMQENLELLPRQQFKAEDHHSTFVQFLSLQHSTLKEQHDKEDLIRANGFACQKIVITLLAEIVTFYKGISKVQFEETSFEGLFTSIYLDRSQSQKQIQNRYSLNLAIFLALAKGF